MKAGRRQGRAGTPRGAKPGALAGPWAMLFAGTAVAAPLAAQGPSYLQLGVDRTSLTVPAFPPEAMHAPELSLAAGLPLSGVHAAELRAGRLTASHQSDWAGPSAGEAPTRRRVEAVPLTLSYVLTPPLAAGPVRPLLSAGVLRVWFRDTVESDTPAYTTDAAALGWHASAGIQMDAGRGVRLVLRGDYRALAEPDERRGAIELDRLRAGLALRVEPGGGR